MLVLHAILEKFRHKMSCYFKKNSKEHDMILRQTDIIEINHCNTSRYYNSAIPFMKRQLNRHYLEKEQEKLNTH